MKGSLKLFLSLCLVFCAALSFQKPVRAASSWYVSTTGSGTVCSPTAPCQPEEAIAKLSSEDTIYFAPGTYTSSDPEWVLHISLTQDDQSLTLYGSCLWDSAGNADCSLDNPRTIIDGENQRVPVLALGTVTTSFQMSYFRITNGNGTGLETGFCTNHTGLPETGCGGGARIGTHAEVMFSYDEFDHNYGSNTAAVPGEISVGGAFYVDHAVQMIISNATFHDNYAGANGQGSGGGGYVNNVDRFYVLYSDFYQNQVSSNGSDGEGAGLAVNNTNTTMIVYSTFEDNNNLNPQLTSGSALLLHDNRGETMVGACEFLGNTGASVVRIERYSTDYQLVIVRNQFLESGALTALSFFGAFQASIENNIFAPYHGARSVQGAKTTGIFLQGAGTPIPQSVANLAFNTITSADRGVYVADYMHAVIENNIIANTTDTGILVGGTMGVTTLVDNNLFHGNAADGETGASFLTGDPCFLNPAAGDFHLTSPSAAIGKAAYDPQYPTDFDGDSRQRGPWDMLADVGADEFRGLFMPLIAN